MNNPPRIIELVGLAGTGKSTLLRALQQRNPRISKYAPPPELSLFLTLIRRLPLWLPLYIKRHGGQRPFDLDDAWCIHFLDTWLSHLQSYTSNGSMILALDPGSVYWLTRLYIFARDDAGHPAFRGWWQEKREQWTSGLDLIIWLDVPEDLCLKRVLERDEEHEAKHEKPEDVLNRFRQFRAMYGEIVLRAAARQPAKAFFFRTDEISTEQIVERILTAVDLASAEPCREYQPKS